MKKIRLGTWLLAVIVLLSLVLPHRCYAGPWGWHAYEVRPGDTLWSLSRKSWGLSYLRGPFRLREVNRDFGPPYGEPSGIDQGGNLKSGGWIWVKHDPRSKDCVTAVWLTGGGKCVDTYVHSPSGGWCDLLSFQNSRILSPWVPLVRR